MVRVRHQCDAQKGSLCPALQAGHRAVRLGPDLQMGWRNQRTEAPVSEQLGRILGRRQRRNIPVICAANSFSVYPLSSHGGATTVSCIQERQRNSLEGLAGFEGLHGWGQKTSPWQPAQTNSAGPPQWKPDFLLPCTTPTYAFWDHVTYVTIWSQNSDMTPCKGGGGNPNWQKEVSTILMKWWLRILI